MQNVAHSAAQHNFAPFCPSILVILLRKMPQAFSAVLFEQIFAIRREAVVPPTASRRIAGRCRKERAKSVPLGKTHGFFLLEKRKSKQKENRTGTPFMSCPAFVLWKSLAAVPDERESVTVRLPAATRKPDRNAFHVLSGFCILEKSCSRPRWRESVTVGCKPQKRKPGRSIFYVLSGFLWPYLSFS